MTASTLALPPGMEQSLHCVLLARMVTVPICATGATKTACTKKLHGRLLTCSEQGILNENATVLATFAPNLSVTHPVSL